MRDDVPVGQARSDKRLLRFDLRSGEMLGEGAPPQAAGGTFGRSQRNTVKGLHRMTAIGDWTLSFNVARGVSLDGNAPVHDADLQAMLTTTLSAYRALLPDTPMRALRLRLYGGMQQGIVITGEVEARQRVLNAATGQPANRPARPSRVTHRSISRSAGRRTRSPNRCIAATSSA